MKIYNSLTKQKELFKPINENKINLYKCGQTVYDFCHIGHARSMLVFDMVVRYLRYKGYEVKYVENITDIDDKIIKRANENKESIKALTKRMIQAMHEDQRALGILPPDEEPRATDFISNMIDMIQTLIDKGYAYVAKNGDVMYAINKFEGYGKLSHCNLDEMQAGSRVEVSSAKENPFDFVLWKMSKPDEPFWPSPWGEGRPGWHIECSVMSAYCLNNEIDIHGGGMDLKFPHHENEIAQSEACTGHSFANYWMHAGFLQVDNEKMSKSLGNFFLIRDALKKFSPEQIRYFMLSNHYLKPVNYSDQTMLHAQEALTRFYQALRGLTPTIPPEKSEFEERFQAAMDDDFNSPKALAVLFDLAREINKTKESDLNRAASLSALLIKLGDVFGVLQLDPEKFFHATDETFDVAQIEDLIAQRNQARLTKDFEKADQVRGELAKNGIVLEDCDEGTIWRKE